MEKIWKQNLKQLDLIFDPKHMTKRTAGWNEINLVDIKIKECYIPISIYDSQDDADYDTKGIEIAGYLEYKEAMSGTKRLPILRQLGSLLFQAIREQGQGSSSRSNNRQHGPITRKLDCPP